MRLNPGDIYKNKVGIELLVNSDNKVTPIRRIPLTNREEWERKSFLYIGEFLFNRFEEPERFALLLASLGLTEEDIEKETMHQYVT